MQRLTLDGCFHMNLLNEESFSVLTLNLSLKHVKLAWFVTSNSDNKICNVDIFTVCYVDLCSRLYVLCILPYVQVCMLFMLLLAVRQTESSVWDTRLNCICMAPLFKWLYNLPLIHPHTDTLTAASYHTRYWSNRWDWLGVSVLLPCSTRVWTLAVGF